jgi:hypothetical protein
MDNKSEEHLTSATYKEQIDVWYRSNNIVREKSELYYDFLSTLLNLIDETYLGSDVIQTEDDMNNHFNWCFNKIISNFEQERIYFITKGFYEYLWVFFHKGYYTCAKKDKYQILSEHFRTLFNFNQIKSPIELESFINFYKILDQNLKKTN